MDASTTHLPSISTISTPDDNTQILIRCFEAINKKHFKNAITATVIWQVPKGTVSAIENPNYFIITPTQNNQFSQALKHLESGNLEQAAMLFTPLADAGHKDSQLALTHLLKKLKGDWKKYAEMHNASVRSVQSVPAACYSPDTQVIAIHPHLQSRNVPQFVLRYLIYHECCHQVIPVIDDNQHPPAFLELEHAAPHRNRAIAWLEKEGFPTLRV
ncbi:MAG: hypothetical protein MI976_01255 [Pseudomonadales bacterium]|nr:hypothetical protein [Pseudomonadales bacterium]